MAGISYLMASAIRLQLIQAPALRQKAIAQQQSQERPFVPRRPIVDRNGQVLAIDRPAYTLYAHPMLFKQAPGAIAAALAPIVDRSEADLIERFSTAESGIQIEYALTEQIARRVTRMRMDGLELVKHQLRLYPHADLVSEVVGYVNVDRQGKAGIEAAYQNFLERSVPQVLLNRAGDGSIVPTQLPVGFLDTDELQLVLTVDSRLQRIARFALQRQMENFQAKRGAAIVMNAADGAILSLVVEPSYDANLYYKSDLELLKNWAISDLYEPGSTFKPLNVAIALEMGAISPNSIFNDEGKIEVDGWPIQNHDYAYVGSRGPLSVTQILQHSSNVGMVHLMRQVPSALYYNWLKRLGLGQTVGVDLPAEISGQMKTQMQFTSSPVEPATAAFGQGFALTPIQLAQLQATLANGGYLVTPHFVRGLFDRQGQPHWQPQLPLPKQVFSAQTTQTVLSMMESVVDLGSGKAAIVPDYRIAGKTGTAQKAHPQGGYYENKRITSFVGILPVDFSPDNLPIDSKQLDRQKYFDRSRPAPRYLVLAVVDEPQGEFAFGSTVAAPIVKSIMEALITIEKIPPSTGDRQVKSESVY